MKKIFLICFLLVAGCAYQETLWIEPPARRVIVKEVPAGPTKPAEKEEFFESRIFPDLTRGYVENKAFPYLFKVFLIRGSQRIVLIGPEDGPPNVAIGEIREFNLPPGDHVLHIERWQNLGGYGGWQKIRQVEVVKVSVAQFRPGGWQYWTDRYYGWWVVVYPDYATVYSGYVR